MNDDDADQMYFHEYMNTDSYTTNVGQKAGWRLKCRITDWHWITLNYDVFIFITLHLYY